jgi:hypothetical protein
MVLLNNLECPCLLAVYHFEKNKNFSNFFLKDTILYLIIGNIGTKKETLQNEKSLIYIIIGIL